MSRLVLALVLIAACEPARSDDQTPTPTPPPPPVPTIPVDPRVACRIDNDCEVFTSCCAHCGRGGPIVSVNKQHREIGNALTLTFYCPMCAEGGCTTMAPSYEPICKRGTCARRETYTDYDRKKVSKVVELDNEPGLMDRGEALLRSRALAMAVLYHACERLQACGTKEPGCPVTGVPDADQNQTQACRDAMDKMPCANLTKVLLAKPPPACAQFLPK